MRLHDADAGAADERAEQSDERRGRDRESVLRIVVVVKEYIEVGLKIGLKEGRTEDEVPPEVGEERWEKRHRD